MGSRGPKPGFKRARIEAAPEVEAAPVAEPLAYCDRDNPNKLTGDALKAYAYRQGMARSTLETMADTKIREALRYITQTRIEEEATA